MRVLRILLAAAVLFCAAGAASSTPVSAGAKVISLTPRGTIPTLSGPTRLRPFSSNVFARPFAGFDPSAMRVIYPYYRASRPWSERNGLRGPAYQTLDKALQTHLRPSRSVPNARNPFRQRIKGGRTARQGSPWAGRFRGGPTVKQGSPWRIRIRY